MSILDLARSAVVTVPLDADVHHAAVLMDDHDVGSVVVVEGDRPVGLVTDRDLAMAVLAERTDPAGLTAEAVMSADPVTVEASAGIYDALRAATEAGVRRLPVVADDGTLAGIVTLDDFVVLLAGELDNVSAIVQAESPPY